MEQQIQLSQEKRSFFIGEDQEKNLQRLIDRLSLKKDSWEEFHRKAGDLQSSFRLVSSDKKRTLLHLAVLDNQLEVIRALRHDPILKGKEDHFGLNPLDIGKFLNRKEALDLLQPTRAPLFFPPLPLPDSFEYLSHPVFQRKEDFEQILNSVSKMKEEDKIPAEKIWMGVYFDKEIRKGVHPPISVRRVDEEVGYGVFAQKKISPCSYAGEYTGLIDQIDPKQLKKERYCLRYGIGDGKKHFVLNAKEKGNFTRFINHSRDPNLGLHSVYWRGVPRMIFIALKEIPEGGELTFDYGPIFWKHHLQSVKQL